MGKNLLKRKLFAGIFVCALLFSGCANDGEPETWEDQDGLVARNFVAVSYTHLTLPTKA